MAVPVTVIVKGKNYTGEYQIGGRLLRVYFDGKSKTSSLSSPNPEFLARLLLIELVAELKGCCMLQSPAAIHPRGLSTTREKALS